MALETSPLRADKTSSLLLSTALLVLGALANPAWGADGPPCPYPGSPTYPGLPGVCHPYPQPRPPASVQTHFCGDSRQAVASCGDCPAGQVCRTHSDTGAGIFPPSNPFNYKTFPGSNFLPSVFTNMFDGGGVEMANTLPSTPDIPYHLHATDPVIREINPTSPTDDLEAIIAGIRQDAAKLEELRGAFDRTTASVLEEMEFLQGRLRRQVRFAIDILEGNPIANRAYSGFPLLHYTGPEKVRKVKPIRDASGKVIGGNVVVRQLWYGQHIESDTALLDPSEVLEVPWTVTYVVDVLNRGHDDFSPFVTYTDTPWYDTTSGKPCPFGPGTAERQDHCARLPAWFDKATGQPCTLPDGPERKEECVFKAGPPPHIGMDQSFFDMEDGTRTTFEILMTPGDYLNLIYTWGWRMHPPRIQVIEKATKKVANPFPPGSDGFCPSEYGGCALPQLEQAVFCDPEDPSTPHLQPGDPLPGGGTNTCSIADLPACDRVRCPPDATGAEAEACRRNQLYAISRIGDLSPAKRMWTVLTNEIQPVLRDAAVLWAKHPVLAPWQACREAGEGDCSQLLESLELAQEDALFHPWARIAALLAARVEPAYLAWLDRTELPCFARDPEKLRPFNCLDGLNPDPNSDISILFVNNTIYGQLTQGGWVRWLDWESRYAVSGKDAVLQVTAHNADHFPHSYVIADFGGNRGWENQFKSSVKVAGSGCWFTFGRAHWWLNTGGPNGFLCVPPASGQQLQPPYEGLGERRFEVQFNFEPSRRLRFYQFDAFHHDVAIYSVH